jgi:hypothetical protein
MVKNNRSKLQVKIVDGVKTYYKAGQWYCDFNNYITAHQGKSANIEGFIRWCETRDLSPTG